MKKYKEQLNEDQDYPSEALLSAARTCALRDYCHDTDDIELDDGLATVSASDDGVWVQAWLWVSKEDVEREMNQ